MTLPQACDQRESLMTTEVNVWLFDRCRKLPRALKEWQAYKDLRKTIDDFNSTCPLLEMMASKSMQPRHWDRIAQITGHVFDIDADNFLLRNLMMAPLPVSYTHLTLPTNREV